MSVFLQQRHEALSVVLEQPRLLSYETSIRLESFSNGRGASHGAAYAKAEKIRTQRQAGLLAGQIFRGHLKTPAAFFVVLLVRIAPRSLDSDNIEHAWKAVRDGVAEGLGIDDRDARVRYVVDQRKGDPNQHLMRLELYAAPKVFVDPLSELAPSSPATREVLTDFGPPSEFCDEDSAAMKAYHAAKRRKASPTPNYVRPR